MNVDVDKERWDGIRVQREREDRRHWDNSEEIWREKDKTVYSHREREVQEAVTKMRDAPGDGSRQATRVTMISCLCFHTMTY